MSIIYKGLKPLKIKESPLTFESKGVNPARTEPVVIAEPISLESAAYAGPELGRVPITPRYRSVMALQDLFLVRIFFFKFFSYY